MITKVNNNLPITTKISTLSDQVLEIFGLVQQAKFSENDVSQLTTDFGLDRKYLRNQSLGHTLLTYSNWSHLHSESGYSIWKYSPTNYKYNSVNMLYLDDKDLENRGEANSESDTAFTYVYLDAGSVFTNNTTEAGTEDGTSFDLMNDTSDYLYVGLSSTFAGISFEFDSRGSNYTNEYEYYNGSVWTTLDISGNTFVDDTSNFESDGRVYWTIPSNWVQVSVNSQTKYWVRVSTSTTPVTVATAYLITPANSVISLLKMSSAEILDEDWAWCSYGSSIYVTIRNAGQSAYEGNYYITSSSTSINKQNYFIHNHEFTADYEDSTYVATSISFALDDLSDVLVNSGLVDGNVLIWDAGDGVWRNGTISETMSHSGLSDMPDTGGTNSDHDARYYTESEVNSLLSAKQSLDAGLTSLAGLTFTSTAFVKYTAENTFSLDTATYSLTSHSHTLDELSDVSIGSGGPLAGQLIRYTIAYGWHNWTPNYLTADRIDDTKGNGDTTYIWSADKVYDQLALKANIDSPTFTGTVGGITPTMVGLGNVTNNAQYYAGGTDVPITDGGTGASSAQIAINNLTQVSAATNEYVLTKDTVTGNATWKVSAGGSLSLDQLSDVMVSSGLIDGQGLYWDAGDAMWRNITPVEGVTAHSLLTQLDYASAGHTGFQASLINSAGLSTAIGGDVAVVDGGTGKSSWTQYLIPYADTTTSFSQIAIGSSGQVLTSRGTGYSPTFQTLSVSLDSLSDVMVSSGLSEGEALFWDNGDAIWRNRGVGEVFSRIVILKVIADDTALTTGDGKMYFTVPVELNGMNLVSVGAHIYTVSSSGGITVAIYNKTDSVDMLSTNITIDAEEYDSKDASDAPVINENNDGVATGEEIRIDVDGAGTGTKGLEVRMGFKTP